MKNILYNRNGSRKFLTSSEVEEFVAATLQFRAERRTLCLLLVWAGCTIAEVLELTIADIDVATDCVYLGKEGVQRRAVPLPHDLIVTLDAVHGVSMDKQKNLNMKSKKLWDVDRTTASRWICRSMDAAGIVGPQAGPQGLRYACLLREVRNGTPASTIS